MVFRAAVIFMMSPSVNDIVLHFKRMSTRSLVVVVVVVVVIVVVVVVVVAVVVVVSAAFPILMNRTWKLECVLQRTSST